MKEPKKEGSCYEDIIHLPHHMSDSHPPMSLSDRAAQFSPFAALNGYEAAIEETARFTEEKRELYEEGRAALDEKLGGVLAHMQEYPEITVTFFLPDGKKSGGSYCSVTGKVKMVDSYKRMIYMMDGQKIRMDDIAELYLDFMKQE